MTPIRARLAVAALLGCFSLTAFLTNARADEEIARLAEGAFLAVVVLETLWPDVRLGVGDTDHRWTLAWPLVLGNQHTSIGNAGLAFQPVIEPQFQIGGGAKRAAGFLRTTLFATEKVGQAGPFVEAGGLLATDGSGALLGVGLSIGAPEVGPALNIGFRGLETTEGRRYDLSIDVCLPLTSSEY